MSDPDRGSTHAAPGTAPRGREPPAAASSRELMSLLEDAGVLDRDEARPLTERFPGEFLGDVLVREGMLTEDYLQGLLVRALHIPWLAVQGCSVAPDVAALLPETACRERQVMPLSRAKGFVTLATTNPLDPHLAEWVREETGLEARLVLCSAAGLQALLDAAFQPERSGRQEGDNSPGPALADDGSSDLAGSIEAVVEGLRRADETAAPASSGEEQ